jgi:hypothetical protein
MMRLAGILAVLLVGGIPVLMLPDIRMLAAGAVVWAVCIVALLLPSLGLAVLGAIAGLLMFSGSLLIASSNAVTEAVLMGIAILILLDATYFEQRFRTVDVRLHVAADHLSQMAGYVLVGLLGAVIIILLTPVLSQDLGATIRSFMAGLGIILVLGAVVWKATR